MNCLKRTRRLKVLRRHAIPLPLWRQTVGGQPLFQGMSASETARLRLLTTLFLHDKTFTGIDTDIPARAHVGIAAQACLPVLWLGLELFTGWRSLVIYPDAFYADHAEADEYGIVHHERRVLSGEAWLHGPVILSLADIEQDALHFGHGHNVVIHEIAHKLDMLNGSCNGMPPLPANMAVADWSAAFGQAFAAMQSRLAHRHHPGIDPYAATNPAECFAVFSEYFFAAPWELHGHFPAVYRQLVLYYRQDPLQRLASPA